MKYALLVEYDGTEFYGYQRQRAGVTVQSALEHAGKIILKESVRMFAAGRTDSGVHSKGMVVSFQTGMLIPNHFRFIAGLNALTPEGVTVQKIQKMPEEFHARFSCSRRDYEFLIWNGRFPSPLWKNRALHIQHAIDLKRIASELEELKGEHDFRSISKPGSTEGKVTKRTILEASIQKDPIEKDLLRIRIGADGFLHNMIRILVGTLLDLSVGKLGQKNILEVLETEDRTKAGVTVPPYGLYFLKAHYAKYPEIDEFYK